MLNNLISSLILSLLTTILLEEICALIWGIRDKKELLLVALVNLVTNPVVVLLYNLTNYSIPNLIIPITILLEAGAIICEWLFYKNYSKIIEKPFIFSLLVNGFSYSMGLLLQNFI